MTFINEILTYENDGLRKLNSITKYPSILTYHNLGQRGSLVDSLVEDKCFDKYRSVYITEKIDGTNSRIVFSTNANGEVDDYIIGSREDFLFAKGDRIVNPALGIVKNMKNIADVIVLFGEDKNYANLKPNSIYCVYGETYGGKINGAKQYSAYGNYDVRIFDMWHMTKKELEVILDMDIEQISSWREHGGQPYVHVDVLGEFCEKFHMTRVPYIEIASGNNIPLDLQGVWDWMQKYSKSVATIDNGALGLSEGVVVRYADRSLIRKIRFEDYTKTKRLGLIK
jgi:hypothetical protein